MENPEIPVTLPTISRKVEEVKIEDTRLIIRTYITRYRGRELMHLVAARYVKLQHRGSETDYRKICASITGKNITLELIRSVIRRLRL